VSRLAALIVLGLLRTGAAAADFAFPDGLLISTPVMAPL